MTTNWLVEFLLSLESWTSCLSCEYYSARVSVPVFFECYHHFFICMLCVRNLANNELVGPIPHEIGSCTALNQL